MSNKRNIPLKGIIENKNTRKSSPLNFLGTGITGAVGVNNQMLEQPTATTTNQSFSTGSNWGGLARLTAPAQGNIIT